MAPLDAGASASLSQRGAILRTGLGRWAKPCASTGSREARLEVSGGSR